MKSGDRTIASQVLLVLGDFSYFLMEELVVFKMMLLVLLLLLMGIYIVGNSVVRGIGPVIILHVLVFYLIKAFKRISPEAHDSCPSKRRRRVIGCVIEHVLIVSGKLPESAKSNMEPR